MIQDWVHMIIFILHINNFQDLIHLNLSKKINVWEKKIV